MLEQLQLHSQVAELIKYGPENIVWIKDIEKKSPVRRQDRRWGLISSGGVQYQKTSASVQRKLY